ncbi:MAG: hypothetical protein JNJ46_13585, partial [Myxococcales bacterium]|nr:hypothetical protein [Myxococcales bacterium]
MTALDIVRQDIEAKARERGFDLTGWFQQNQNRLRVFSDGLQRILSRLPSIQGGTDQGRSQVAHGQLRDSIARLKPEEVAWFDRNRALLISIGAELSREQRAGAALHISVPANGVDSASSAGESYELRGEKERTNANVEAIQILTSKASWDEADREKLRRYT